jgi:predicted DNA-binding protein with PD1-like motif
MSCVVETGTFGRTVSLRIAPNEDMTEAIERACAENGVARAAVRGGIGSLIDACLETGRGRDPVDVLGPAVEVLVLTGEVRPDESGRPSAFLGGTVADTVGRIFGGRFVPGKNRVCVTAEVVFQEWLPTT